MHTDPPTSLPEPTPTPTPYNLSECSVIEGAKVTTNSAFIGTNSAFVIYGFTSDDHAIQWVTALNRPHPTRSGYLQDLKLNNEILRVRDTHPWVYKKDSSTYNGNLYNRIQIDASGGVTTIRRVCLERYRTWSNSFQ